MKFLLYVKIYAFKYIEIKDLDKNPFDYDTWFDLVRLVENEENLDEIRDTYEQAIAQIPPLVVNKNYTFIKSFCN